MVSSAMPLTLLSKLPYPLQSQQQMSAAHLLTMHFLKLSPIPELDDIECSPTPSQPTFSGLRPSLSNLPLPGGPVGAGRGGPEGRDPNTLFSALLSLLLFPSRGLTLQGRAGQAVQPVQC
jgi:hypothetical protein